MAPARWPTVGAVWLAVSTAAEGLEVVSARAHRHGALAGGTGSGSPSTLLAKLATVELANHYCVGFWGVDRKRLNGTSAGACAASAEADPECGQELYFGVSSAGEQQCRCVLAGRSCRIAPAPSRATFDVYKLISAHAQPPEADVWQRLSPQGPPRETTLAALAREPRRRTPSAGELIATEHGGQYCVGAWGEDRKKIVGDHVEASAQACAAAVERDAECGQEFYFGVTKRGERQCRCVLRGRTCRRSPAPKGSTFDVYTFSVERAEAATPPAESPSEADPPRRSAPITSGAAPLEPLPAKHPAELVGKPTAESQLDDSVPPEPSPEPAAAGARAAPAGAAGEPPSAPAAPAAERPAEPSADAVPAAATRLHKTPGRAPAASPARRREAPAEAPPQLRGTPSAASAAPAERPPEAPGAAASAEEPAASVEAAAGAAAAAARAEEELPPVPPQLTHGHASQPPPAALFGTPGGGFCAGEPMYSGPTAGWENCRARCGDAGCGFWSYWHNSPVHWCRLTSHCDGRLQDGVHTISAYWAGRGARLGEADSERPPAPENETEEGSQADVGADAGADEGAESQLIGHLRRRTEPTEARQQLIASEWRERAEAREDWIPTLGGWPTGPNTYPSEIRTVNRSCREPIYQDKCHKMIIWAMNKGMREHPEWYPGLDLDSNWTQYQEFIHRRKPDICPEPCWHIENATARMAQDTPAPLGGEAGANATEAAADEGGAGANVTGAAAEGLEEQEEAGANASGAAAEEEAAPEDQPPAPRRRAANVTACEPRGSARRFASSPNVSYRDLGKVGSYAGCAHTAASSGYQTVMWNAGSSASGRCYGFAGDFPDALPGDCEEAYCWRFGDACEAWGQVMTSVMKDEYVEDTKTKVKGILDAARLARLEGERSMREAVDNSTRAIAEARKPLELAIEHYHKAELVSERIASEAKGIEEASERMMREDVETNTHIIAEAREHLKEAAERYRKEQLDSERSASEAKAIEAAAIDEAMRVQLASKSKNMRSLMEDKSLENAEAKVKGILDAARQARYRSEQRMREAAKNNTHVIAEARERMNNAMVLYRRLKADAERNRTDARAAEALSERRMHEAVRNNTRVIALARQHMRDAIDGYHIVELDSERNVSEAKRKEAVTLEEAMRAQLAAR